MEKLSRGHVLLDIDPNGAEQVLAKCPDTTLIFIMPPDMEELEKRGIPYDVTPGVSSFCGAAAALGMEYTLPGISQSVILTRMEGRTKVPEKESIESFAAHFESDGTQYFGGTGIRMGYYGTTDTDDFFVPEFNDGGATVTLYEIILETQSKQQTDYLYTVSGGEV
jgi:hypothetical protein